MASSISREWSGFRQLSPAAQQTLDELLEKLIQSNFSTLTVLVMGKGGVGKSSTVNSIFGERLAAVSTFQSEGLRPTMWSRLRSGFTLNIVDSPGIIDGGYINEHALDIIKRFLLNKRIDVLLYVDRLNAYRVDTLDRQVIKAITDSFGKRIWRRTVVVLTHAQSSPPDGLDYNEFSAKRSEVLLRCIRAGAGIKRKEYEENPIPVVLAENSGRCRLNDSGEKVLPNGIAWIPNLVKTIADSVLNGGESITVDQKLIDGPNPNARGKVFIPLIAAVQYFLIRRMRQVIKNDIAKESKPLWELRDLGLANREF